MKQGKGSIFLPVGIEGTYRVYSPDIGKRRISSDVMNMLMGDFASQQLVTVRVGDPFTYAGTETPGDMTAQIARLLPDAHQGFYRAKNH